MLIPFLVLWGEELLHWSFHFLLVAEALQVLEVNHGLEHVIIRRDLGLDYMMGEATYLPVVWSHADIKSCDWDKELLHWSFYLLSMSTGSEPWIGTSNYPKGSRSGLYDGWSYLSASCLIPCWYQILWLRWRTPSLKLLPPLGCWSIARAESDPWIKTSNNPRELDPDSMLGVASVQFLPVFGVYSIADIYTNIARLLTHPFIIKIIIRFFLQIPIHENFFLNFWILLKLLVHFFLK